MVASSLDALSPVLLSGFNDRADLAASLKASACVPEIAGGPILHRSVGCEHSWPSNGHTGAFIVRGTLCYARLGS